MKLINKLIILITIVIFIVPTQDANAQQTYSLFPDSNIVWLMEVYSGGPGPDWYYIDSTGSDTIINMKNYTKLFNCAGFNLKYLGAYRSDTNGRTFYVLKDSISEYLMRDFSANQGDTVKDVYIGGDGYFPENFALVDLYVDTVRYVIVGPYLLKWMELSNQAVFDTLHYSITGYGHTIRWVEKIGCIDGGFYNHTYMGVMGGSLHQLYCTHYNDTVYNYYEGTMYQQGHCINPNSINENNKEEINIIVSPNPFTDNIRIENKNAYDIEYIIYNSLGQKVTMPAMINALSSSEIINMEGLHSGIYFIQISSENAKRTSLKIIKY